MDLHEAERAVIDAAIRHVEDPLEDWSWVSLNDAVAEFLEAREVTWKRERRGLCPERERHVPHHHPSTTLGTYWCTGEPNGREPNRSEQVRRDQS